MQKLKVCSSKIIAILWHTLCTNYGSLKSRSRGDDKTLKSVEKKQGLLWKIEPLIDQNGKLDQRWSSYACWLVGIRLLKKGFQNGSDWKAFQGEKEGSTWKIMVKVHLSFAGYASNLSATVGA